MPAHFVVVGDVEIVSSVLRDHLVVTEDRREPLFVDRPGQSVPELLADSPGDTVDRLLEDALGVDFRGVNRRLFEHDELLQQVREVVGSCHLPAAAVCGCEPESPVPPA